jgi:hypothetical protein
VYLQIRGHPRGLCTFFLMLWDFRPLGLTEHRCFLCLIFHAPFYRHITRSHSQAESIDLLLLHVLLAKDEACAGCLLHTSMTAIDSTVRHKINRSFQIVISID